MAVVVERGVEPPTSKAKRRGRGCCKLLRETENLRESVQFATRRPSFPRSALKGWIEPRYSRAELEIAEARQCSRAGKTATPLRVAIVKCWTNEKKDEKIRKIYLKLAFTRVCVHAALLSETFEGESKRIAWFRNESIYMCLRIVSAL